jgi:hypothetical protein
MSQEQRVKAENDRLKKMGSILIFMAISFSLSAYIIPPNSMKGFFCAEGVYAVSGFFGFLGLYCFGGAWRRRNFI